MLKAGVRFIGMLSGIIALGGCLVDADHPVEVEIEQPAPRPVQGTLNCNDGGPTWHWDAETSSWYYTDGQGNRHYGTPPCWGGSAQVQMPATIPSTREGLGLVPNSSDKIKPLIWITRHDAANQGYYSKEDELDLFIAAELEWLMPFESDSELLNAIGAENISYHPVDVSDSSRTRPVLIRFEGIRLGVAIKLLSELGATEVTHNGGSTSRVGSRIMLNDSVEEYSAALVYEGENHLSTIELE